MGTPKQVEAKDGFNCHPTRTLTRVSIASSMDPLTDDPVDLQFTIAMCLHFTVDISQNQNTKNNTNDDTLLNDNQNSNHNTTNSN